jgi:uncharacterized protein YdiU (UPF0061 family)
MIAFASRYAALPEHYFARLGPTPVARPRLIEFNRALGEELGLDTRDLNDEQLAAIFSGNLVPEGANPIAMAYAGHQFGVFVPQLGDGRAILLGEVRDKAGRWRDVQLKGSGRTPYSRNGDGRAALGPVLREYLVSEAMHQFGIPTTRSLAAVSTGEAVFREERLPGAILTRVALSHVRVGTFQYFAAREDTAAIRRLADFAIERLYPALASQGQPYLALLDRVIDAQAQLVARWMHIGFIHGVMNTDNMAISGETIDYGPCAFMDSYDPKTAFSSIDHNGRYAYANQPVIAQWNLARFAETLLFLIDPDPEKAVALATEVLEPFIAQFDDRFLAGMRRKLGLSSAREGDADLVRRLLTLMRHSQADFTLTFRRLALVAENPAEETGLRELFEQRCGLDGWVRDWRERLASDPQTASERTASMCSVNPAIIPRNHRVQAALEAAENGDYRLFRKLLEILQRPYDDQAEVSAYSQPPQSSERVLQTFCGT